MITLRNKGGIQVGGELCRESLHVRIKDGGMGVTNLVERELSHIGKLSAVEREFVVDTAFKQVP